MILIKGDAVCFQTDSGERICLPRKYGIIHDPTGEYLPRCEIYFGPYRTASGHAKMTKEAEKYFGAKYKAKRMVVDRPKGPWESVAKVVGIFYVRGKRGAIHPGGYRHPFRGKPLSLDKSGKFYRLSLPGGCIVDDRGFVFP